MWVWTSWLLLESSLRVSARSSLSLRVPSSSRSICRRNKAQQHARKTGVNEHTGRGGTTPQGHHLAALLGQVPLQGFDRLCCLLALCSHSRQLLPQLLSARLGRLQVLLGAPQSTGRVVALGNIGAHQQNPSEGCLGEDRHDEGNRKRKRAHTPQPPWLPRDVPGTAALPHEMQPAYTHTKTHTHARTHAYTRTRKKHKEHTNTQSRRGQIS